MTSGMSAKGSALGTDASEGGAVSDHAPMPRVPGNGSKRNREPNTGVNFQEAGITDTPEASNPALSSSVRTLILGIDYDGRIVQHDRNAAKILARKPEDLLGAQLIELTSSHGSPSTTRTPGRSAVSRVMNSTRCYGKQGSRQLPCSMRATTIA